MRLRFTSLSTITMALLFILLAGSVPAESGPKFGKVTDAEWQLGFPADYPEANAIVIFDRCSLMVSPEGIEIVRHVRKKILRAAGAKEVGDVEIYYDEDDDVKDIKAQTINPTGTATKVNSKEIFVKTVTGWKVKTFSFPAADSGCIIEYSYRNLNLRFSYLQPWYFQSDVYTLESRFVLTLYPGFNYSSSYSNVPPEERDPSVTESLVAGDIHTRLMHFAWVRRGLKPVVDEPYMGAKDDYYSALYYQLVSYKSSYDGMITYFIKGWQDMGEEMTEYFNGVTRGTKATQIVDKATVATMSPLEKTRALYAHVAANFAAKPDPEGGWFSHSHLNEMIKEGTGTDDEKNMLLVEVLKGAGIRSWPVMISTRDHRRFNPEIYQLQQFNHIICYAQIDDTSGVYLDASTKFCPFGMLPPECLVDGGFLVDGKGSQLVKVLSTAQRTYRLDATQMVIDSLGAARCSTTCSLTGYIASVYGQLSEKQAIADFIDDYFLDKVSENTTVISQDLKVDSTGRVEITVVYTVPDYARALDANMVVKPVSYRFRENPFEREKRFYPIDFEYPYTYHNVVVIQSDRMITDATLPPQVSSSAPGLSFKRSAQFMEGKVHLDAKLTITNDLINPVAYPDVKKLFEDIAHASQDEVILQVGSL